MAVSMDTGIVELRLYVCRWGGSLAALGLADLGAARCTGQR